MREASAPRRWPAASTTNQLRSISLARGAVCPAHRSRLSCSSSLNLCGAPSALARAPVHAAELSRRRRPAAGDARAARTSSAVASSVPDAQERGHHAANHLAQERVPDHVDGDPTDLLRRTRHPVNGPDRLSIPAAEGGEVVRPDEHLRRRGHCLDVERLADTKGVSLAQRARGPVPDRSSGIPDTSPDSAGVKPAVTLRSVPSPMSCGSSAPSADASSRRSSRPA